MKPTENPAHKSIYHKYYLTGEDVYISMISEKDAGTKVMIVLSGPDFSFLDFYSKTARLNAVKILRESST